MELGRRSMGASEVTGVRGNAERPQGIGARCSLMQYRHWSLHGRLSSTGSSRVTTALGDQGSSVHTAGRQCAPPV